MKLNHRTLKSMRGLVNRVKLNRRTLGGLRGIDKESLITLYGQEFLGLRPEVLAQVLAHGMPGDVYGGTVGFQLPAFMVGTQFIMPLYKINSEGNVEGVLTTPDGKFRIADSNTMQEIPYDTAIWTPSFRISNDTGGYEFGGMMYTPEYESIWLPLSNRGYVQVRQNPYNHSWLSLGAAGGYRDPRLIDWDERYGLITPISNFLQDQDSFWESWGPFILASMAIGGVAAAGVAQGAGAGAAAEGSVATTGGSFAAGDIIDMGITANVGEGITATEAFTAGEEALREIEFAKLAGATVTQGEAAGWVAALNSAGLSVPTDIASIASGSSGSRYQSPPSSSSAGTTTSQSVSPLTQAGQIVSNPLVKTAAGLISAGIASQATGNNPAPLARSYSYASPDMVVDYSKTRAQTTGKAITDGIVSFNWLWLLVAGAGVYYIKQKSRRVKRHAVK